MIFAAQEDAASVATTAPVAINAKRNDTVARIRRHWQAHAPNPYRADTAYELLALSVEQQVHLAGCGRVRLPRRHEAAS